MIRIISTSLAALSLYACGVAEPIHQSSGGNKLSIEDQDLANLQTKAPQDQAELIGLFGIYDSSNAAGFVAFSNTDHYIAGLIQRVSDIHYRAQAAVGSYQQTGNTIAVQGLRTTCPRTRVNKTAGTVYGTPTGNSITLNIGSKTVVLTRFNTTKQPKNGAVIEWGCLLDDNDQPIPFTAHEWTDIVK